MRGAGIGGRDDELRLNGWSVSSDGKTEMVGLPHYVALGGILFALGVVGFLCRRNLIIMFLCTEIMFQGVIVTLAAFAWQHGHVQGQVFALFLVAIAAVEAGLALGLVVLLYQRKGTLDAEAWQSMRG